jgi:hypothetical protein
MQKKEKSKIVLNPLLDKIIRGYCTANNRDINEFLEEAIIEKIEYEELNKDGVQNETVEVLSLDETDDQEFKRKH